MGPELRRLARAHHSALLDRICVTQLIQIEEKCRAARLPQREIDRVLEEAAALMQGARQQLLDEVMADLEAELADLPEAEQESTVINLATRRRARG